MDTAPCKEDALGTVNAVVGGGVGYALQSGRFAAEYISAHENLDSSGWHTEVLRTPWGKSIDESAKIIGVAEVIYRRHRDMFNYIARMLNQIDDDFVYRISQGAVKWHDLVAFVMFHPVLSLKVMAHLRPLRAIYKYEFRSMRDTS